MTKNSIILVTLFLLTTHQKNGLKRKIKFIPSSNKQKKNIDQLANLLAKNWNYFQGLPANDLIWKDKKKWLMGWINEQGYLTTEKGRKVILPNSKRLRIWLSRYLKKRHIILKKGKTYYFSRELSCRVPCDHGHIPERSYALYKAREALQEMLNDSKEKV